MDPASLELLWRVAVALGVGLLLGLERGWHQRDLPEGSRAAGIRTFALVGLCGGLAAVLEPHAGLWLLALGFLPLAALVVVVARPAWRSAVVKAGNGDRGITTEIALLVAYLLGATAGFGELALAAATGVIVTLLLGVKQPLHALLKRISQEELYAVLKLLVMSLVLLPLLPDRGFGPYDALNPHRLWWMVVLVAGISSAGYFAIRLLGTKRGLLLTAALGGLASSTAVTAAMARQARTDASLAAPAAGAALLAGAILAPRLLLIVFIVNQPLAWPLLWPLLALFLGSLAGAVFFYRGAALQRSDPKLGNPFELGPALQLGALLAVIMVLSEALPRWLGNAGIIVLAGVAGLADTDAVTLSFASKARDATLLAELAVWGILVAVAVNSLVKSGIGWVLGNRAFGWRLTLGYLFALALGAAALLIPPLSVAS